MTQDDSRVALLQDLSSRHPEFLVWKHLDRCLRGKGDVDAAVPAGTAAAVAADARAAAGRTLGATTVITCPHIADKHIQFFVQPERLPQLFELDLCQQPSRGLAPWASPAQMLPLTIMSPHGIRHLSPGAEAVVSLVYHGISPGGDDRLTGDERALVDTGLTTDLSAAVQACHTLVPRPARRHVLALVHACREGEWDRLRAAQAHRGFVASGAAHPRHTARRIAFRLRLARGGECVMSKLAREHDRQVLEADLGSLLETAQSQGHQVLAC